MYPYSNLYFTTKSDAYPLTAQIQFDRGGPPERIDATLVKLLDSGELVLSTLTPTSARRPTDLLSGTPAPPPGILRVPAVCRVKGGGVSRG